MSNNKQVTTELDQVHAAISPDRKQINDAPELLSILYDIDLLPEQIKNHINAARLIAFCEIWKRLP